MPFEKVVLNFIFFTVTIEENHSRLNYLILKRLKATITINILLVRGTCFSVYHHYLVP